MYQVKRASLLLVLFALFTSCGPEILQFDIEPQYVARGDSVKVSWEVHGNATLQTWSDCKLDADPNAPEAALLSQSRVPSRGSMKLQINQPVELHIVATKGGDTADWPGQVWLLESEAWVDTLRLKTDTLGIDSLKAALNYLPELSAEVEVAGIVLFPDRTAVISHGGRSALVSAGVYSTEFNGLPARGEWVIRTARLPSEPYGTGPEELNIQIDLKNNSQR